AEAGLSVSTRYGVVRELSWVRAVFSPMITNTWPKDGTPLAVESTGGLAASTAREPATTTVLSSRTMAIGATARRALNMTGRSFRRGSHHRSDAAPHMEQMQRDDAVSDR